MNSQVIPSPPLALYSHFPWCVQKCPYCDFNSHRAPEVVPEQQYVDALLADLEFDLAQHFAAQAAPEIISIFLGGGTPSLFSPAMLDRLLMGVRARLVLSSKVEITLEANPGTVEHGRFSEYASVGINRVSLGAQSFSDSQLLRLGRIHGADEIARAVDELKRAGLNNFNLDLMYGLPEQTLPEALEDLQRAIALEPMHLSHYQLTLEPGTAFYHQPPPMPDDELAYAMQQDCQARLADGGYRQYEVSAYTRQREAAHNRNYWEFGDYLGLGAGAHGKLTVAGQVWRTERTKSPRAYLQAAPAARLVRNQVIPADALPFEFMLNALRLVDGFAQARFAERTGLAWQVLDQANERALALGLLEMMPAQRWRPTPRGREMLNELIGLYL